ncbi:MAG TPA: hypothetical protein DEQ34_15005 [Balneolaceae bacterium]|nr:hypothetical protein [Balneolaceae bacterium]|tara:strand:+ start:118970 stop:120079 length:1110 start_codon:yes stop_codon:yes gene_type:complete
MKKLAILALVFVSCAATTDPERNTTNEKEYGFELYVEGIEVPWGFDWLPNGDMLVTERGGDLFLVREGEIVSTISNVPDDLVQQGQGGFMDVRVHPDYEENGWIYFTYASTEGEGDGANTKVIRTKLEGNALTGTEVLYKAGPNSNRGQHFGSRLEFDNNGYLYFTVGDRGNRDVYPQDITSDMGKVYRIFDDGRIPEDNPFYNESGAKKAIYSYGHRNQQGMEMNPWSGKIWAHEHGPQGGDELNIIQPGKNYGWPVISYGINYNGTEFAEDTARAGMEQPATYWVPSIAPSGMAFVTSDTYPDWKGHLLVGSLKFGFLHLVKLDGDTVTGREEVLNGIGRVRSVEEGPDGIIYVGVEGKGIYKVTAK